MYGAYWGGLALELHGLWMHARQEYRCAARLCCSTRMRHDGVLQSWAIFRHLHKNLKIYTHRRRVTKNLYNGKSSTLASILHSCIYHDAHDLLYG